MKILVINCGSSSLKYQLIDMDGEKVLCKGLCERIGMESSMITHDANGDKAHDARDLPHPHRSVPAKSFKKMTTGEGKVIEERRARSTPSATAWCTAARSSSRAA